MNGTNDLTAKMLCSIDNNFNLTRYNSIKIRGNDKGEQKYWLFTIRLYLAKSPSKC